MDKKGIKKCFKEFLKYIDEDPQREDLKKTPHRVAEMYEELLWGNTKDPEKVLEVLLTEDHDEIVLLRDIPLYSICEHHLLPFYGKAHVGYIPKENRVTGLSKLARVVEILSRRLQVQERLTTQIADVIMKKLAPLGVIVIIEAEHLCMTMRGVKKPGATTVTSAVRGIFKTNPKTRSEVMDLIRK